MEFYHFASLEVWLEDWATLLGSNQLGLFLWNLLVRRSHLKAHNGTSFFRVFIVGSWNYVCLCMCVFFATGGIPLEKSKAKFFSLLPEPSDRLIRKNDDSNKRGRGVHSWDSAADKMINPFTEWPQRDLGSSLSPRSFWWREVTLPLTHHIRSRCSINSFGDHLFNLENRAVCF